MPDEKHLKVKDRPTCPECEQGKHGNCDGSAWDRELDEPTICLCWMRGH